MRTNRRKNYQGIVVSTAMDKTITVQVDTYRAHKLYGKRYRYSKKFHVHDENNEAKSGDKVLIMETKPYSKTKYFRLVKIVEKKDGK